MVLQELILIVSTLRGCGGLQELIFNSLRQCNGLERTDF